MLGLLTFFYSFAVVGIYATCPAGYCFVGPDGCAVSAPGTPCVVCDGRGYVDDGVCVFEEQPFPTLANIQIQSNCEDETQCAVLGVCRDSKYGELCDECFGRGYLTSPTTCECYERQFDPKAACQSLFDITAVPLILNNTLDRITCDAHHNPVMGFYKDNPVGKYGDPHPAVPQQCWSEIYGPPPTQLFESQVPLQACNTYCSYDPDTFFGPEQDGSCKTCAYHGFWNSTSYSCQCFPGWALTYIGQDYYNRSAYVCQDCDGYWGPPPGDAAGPPFCSVPWLPDQNGVLRECSGHGTYTDAGQCSCYSNSTAGFWALAPLMGFQTCAVCQVGYALPDCKLGNGETYAPTRFPTSHSPSESPTAAYNQCPQCPGASLGQALITNSRMDIPSDLNTTCCTYDEFVLVEPTLLQVYGQNGTCLSSFVGRQSLGWTLCANMPNCTGTTFYPYGNNTFAFYFTNETDVEYIESIDAGSSLACD